MRNTFNEGMFSGLLPTTGIKDPRTRPKGAHPNESKGE
jgi:hypothetical protein